MSEELQITLCQLRKWEACVDVLSWFRAKFPQGGTYSAAPGAKAKAATGGVLALAWLDKETQCPRVAVGYVGETLQADTWYALDSMGNFVETDAE